MAEKGSQLRMKQIVIEQYTSEYSGKLSNGIIGLSEEGEVFKYRHTEGGWSPMSMEVIAPVEYGEYKRSQASKTSSRRPAGAKNQSAHIVSPGPINGDEGKTGNEFDYPDDDIPF